MSEHEKQEMFLYLNRLRESGKTNMFGASPYVAGAFGIPEREARKVLLAWMEWVNAEPANLDR